MSASFAGVPPDLLSNVLLDVDFIVGDVLPFFFDKIDLLVLGFDPLALWSVLCDFYK